MSKETETKSSIMILCVDNYHVYSELDHKSSTVMINNWSPRLLHLQIRIIWQRSDHMGASGSPKSDRSLPSMRSGENCWSEEEKTCSRCFFQRNGESLRMVNIYEWKYQDTVVSIGMAATELNGRRRAGAWWVHLSQTGVKFFLIYFPNTPQESHS